MNTYLVQLPKTIVITSHNPTYESKRKQGQGNQCRTPGVKFWAKTVVFWANTVFFANTVVFWANTVVF